MHRALQMFFVEELKYKNSQLCSQFQPYLIELKNIKQVKKLPVLLTVFQLAVILLQSM